MKQLSKEDEARIRFNLAVVEEKRGDHPLAIELYKGVVTLDRSYYQAWKICGELFLEQMRYAEAEDFLRASMIVYPDNSYLTFLLGASLHHQRMFEEAIIQYKKAVGTVHAIYAIYILNILNILNIYIYIYTILYTL